jgi:selenocysteine lyase/cysteine desulfurase
MDGEGEDGIVLAENGGGAVAVVDVGVHYQGADDFVAGLQRANCDGYIVDGTKTFAVAGIGVMEAAAEVAAEAVLEGGFGREYCAAGGQPEGADEFGGIGDFQFHLFAGCEGACF